MSPGSEKDFRTLYMVVLLIGPRGVASKDWYIGSLTLALGGTKNRCQKSDSLEHGPTISFSL
jgi:hypothetical protein